MLNKFSAEEICAALATAIKEMYLQVLEMDTVNEVTEVNGNVTNDLEVEPLVEIAATE